MNTFMSPNSADANGMTAMVSRKKPLAQTVGQSNTLRRRMMAMCAAQKMKISAKVPTKTASFGASAIMVGQNTASLGMAGGCSSSTKSVSAKAKTPSENVSRRPMIMSSVAGRWVSSMCRR
ncbi:MAG TPA: hypothetical protein VHC73_15425 [Vitreimonas sp.]|nr:hypothetical protein [Vitreimonas sp.]